MKTMTKLSVKKLGMKEKAAMERPVEEVLPNPVGVVTFEVRDGDTFWVGDPAGHVDSDVTLRLEQDWAEKFEERVGGTVVLSAVLSNLAPGPWSLQTLNALDPDPGWEGRPIAMGLTAQNGCVPSVVTDTFHFIIDTGTMTVGQRRARAWAREPFLVNQAHLDAHLGVIAAFQAGDVQGRAQAIIERDKLPWGNGGVEVMTGLGDGCYEGTVYRCPVCRKVVKFIVDFQVSRDECPVSATAAA